MHIRPYTAADQEACLAIFDSNPSYFDASEKAYLINWLAGKNEERHSYASNKAEHFYVLEDGNKVRGCGGFYITEAKPVANMVWGMVANADHKKGYGKALFNYRLQQVRELYPGTSIILDTSQHTYPFFEKLGFRVVKITKDAYGKGLDRYDMTA